ncbi:MAG: electron transport complex subunit RsxC [bacterium]|nr:electron transport complex subunit RsxC [bacterium]
MAFKFHGGLRIEEHKELTESQPIVDFPAPKRVIIPLKQHTGAVLEPLVKKGDMVKAGDKIGDSKAFVSSPVHASISGKIISIEPHPIPTGEIVPSIIIEASEDDPIEELATEKRQWQELKREEIVSIVREAGIVGLGGAAFPTSVKLSPPEGVSIDTVILNGAECEPFLTCDHRLMLENPDEVITGLQIIMKVVGAKQGIIGIEDNKKDAIDVLTSKANSYKDIRIVSLPTRYPQGSEKHLIKALLNREVPSGKLPLNVGVVVNNVQTAYSITKAVCEGIPLISRVITVSGDGVEKPSNLRVRIGTQFKDILEYTGLKQETQKVISGGPMTGVAQWTLEVPVIKGTSGIIALTKIEEKTYPCLRCAKCVDTCPMGLLPLELGNLAEQKRFEDAQRLYLLDCIECGSCAYICPSRRPLVHLIKFAKTEINKRRRR